MSSSPLLLLTDTQADTLGSSFPLSPLCLQSPQLSQISPLIVQSPEVDPFWHDPFLGASDFKLELEEIPSYFPDGEVVDYLSVSTDHHFGRIHVEPYHYKLYNSHSPSTFLSRCLATSEVDDGSTSSLSTSPTVLTPVSTRFVCSMPMLTLCRSFGQPASVDAVIALASVSGRTVAPRATR